MRQIMIAALLGMAIAAATAQERIDLSAPETKPSNGQYRVGRIVEDHDDPATGNDEGQLMIQLIGQNGELVSCVYNAATVPTATALLTAQNKADFSSSYAGNGSTGSRRQRIYHRLVVMGESLARCGKTLTGSLAGSVP